MNQVLKNVVPIFFKKGFDFKTLSKMVPCIYIGLVVVCVEIFVNINLVVLSRAIRVKRFCKKHLLCSEIITQKNLKYNFFFFSYFTCLSEEKSFMTTT